MGFLLFLLLACQSPDLTFGSKLDELVGSNIHIESIPDKFDVYGDEGCLWLVDNGDFWIRLSEDNSYARRANWEAVSNFTIELTLFPLGSLGTVTIAFTDDPSVIELTYEGKYLDDGFQTLGYVGLCPF